MKIKFIESPIGKFGLAYAKGMEAEFNKEQAILLIEAGYAVALETETPESNESNEIESPEKPKRKK
jgi:hypothetical protein